MSMEIYQSGTLDHLCERKNALRQGSLLFFFNGR